MDITIKINTDNDAFKGNYRREVVRILRELISRIQVFELYSHAIMDTNGNKVGELTVDNEERADI